MQTNRQQAPGTAATDQVMTLPEVARFLRLGERSVYRMAQQGTIPGKKIASKWRFLRSEIEAWIREGSSTEEES